MPVVSDLSAKPGDLLFRFYTPRVFAVIIVLSAEPQSADTQSDCAVVVWSDAQDVKIRMLQNGASGKRSTLTLTGGLND